MRVSVYRAMDLKELTRTLTTSAIFPKNPLLGGVSEGQHIYSAGG
jgi:hypothetical protein